MNGLPEAYGLEVRKARKDHRCCECHGVIEPGERYHYHHGIWDGMPESYKMCLDCAQLRSEMKNDGSSRIPFGCLEEAVAAGDVPEWKARFAEIVKRRTRHE